MRYAEQATCGILHVSDACVLHTCQTAPGTSGAGLLSMSEDHVVRLLAVHQGGVEREKKCEGIETNSEEINLAVRVN